MNNYYADINTEIELLLKNGKHQEAYLIVKEELNMPYIPSDYEQKFNILFKKIKTKMINLESKAKNTVTIENIKKALLQANNRKNNNILSYYLPFVHQFNYKLLIQEFRFFLKIPSNNYILKSLLLIELIKMKVPEVIELTKNRKKIKINTDNYNFHDRNYYMFKHVIKHFKEKYFIDCPQLYEIAKSAIKYIDLYVFPFQIDIAKQQLLINLVQNNVSENLVLTATNLATLF